MKIYAFGVRDDEKQAFEHLKGSSVSLDFGKLYKASSALTETLYNINHNGEDCDKILIDKQFGEVAKEYKNVINSMQIIEED